MVAPTSEPAAAAAAAEGTACPQCGAEAAPHQQYCLECGTRLTAPEESTASRGRLGRIRGGPMESVLTVLVAFVVAVLAAAAVVTVQLTRDDAELPLLVPTTPAVPAEDEEEPEPAEPAPPLGEEEPVETAEPEPAPPAEPEPPDPGQPISWPPGTDGWTVILQSIPVGDGRGPATAGARRAVDAGLPEVGVLMSSNFSSLHPGYFVVFTGVHDTQAEAVAAVSAARQAGYSFAYARRIAP
jgi:hypothetical protein